MFIAHVEFCLNLEHILETDIVHRHASRHEMMQHLCVSLAINIH
jgi:hypothetical protein